LAYALLEKLCPAGVRLYISEHWRDTTIKKHEHLKKLLTEKTKTPAMPVKEKIKDKWFRIIGIPFIALMAHVIFFNENHGSADEGFSFWQVYLIGVVEATILWEVIRLVLQYYRNRYPDIQQSRRRILNQFAGCMLVTIIIRYLTVWFYDKTLFWGYLFPPEGYLYNIFVGMLYVAIIAGIYESIYFFQKWKQTLSQTEALKRENLQTQLDSLKSQINPHFLFNNLSSLTSLIMEDQGKAVDFVNELAAVYRYLLQANDKNLIELRAELTFIDQYFHLLKTRFGDGIALNQEINERYLSYQLPPLTLQLVVENAVKHNAILPHKPLTIQLYTDKTGNLIVVNNLQRKTTPLTMSNKTGLRNIKEKYRLLNHSNVVIHETAESFQVILPLLKIDAYETIDRRR
jgi:hypothetical protein